jgi:adenosylhomocysteine nucleosidase
LAVDTQPQIHGPTKVWRGRYAGHPLVLAQAGIGKVNAAAAATLMLGVFEVQALVFSGVAGSLDSQLPVGSVVLADKLGIHDYGLLAGGRLTSTASGEMPLGAPELAALPAVTAEVAAMLLSLSQRMRGKLQARVQLGGILTADYFLNCAETRRRLRAQFGALAIDMESGAVSQIAEAWGVPLFVIRTVSDLAGEDSDLTYPRMAQMAAHNSAMCVAELLDMHALPAPRPQDRQDSG